MNVSYISMHSLETEESSEIQIFKSVPRRRSFNLSVHFYTWPQSYELLQFSSLVYNKNSAIFFLTFSEKLMLQNIAEFHPHMWNSNLAFFSMRAHFFISSSGGGVFLAGLSTKDPKTEILHQSRPKPHLSITKNCKKYDRSLHMYRYQILNFLFTTKLNESMPNYRSSLILTVPSTSSTAERSFSTLKHIKSFCRNSCGQARLSSLCTLSVEKELFYSLKAQQNFYDDVINEFCIKERRIDLIYK